MEEYLVAAETDGRPVMVYSTDADDITHLGFSEDELPARQEYSEFMERRHDNVHDLSEEVSQITRHRLVEEAVSSNPVALRPALDDDLWKEIQKRLIREYNTEPPSTDQDGQYLGVHREKANNVIKDELRKRDGLDESNTSDFANETEIIYAKGIEQLLKENSGFQGLL